MRRCVILFTLAVLCAAQSSNKGNIDRSTLDPTCKPCQDFYRYATGGWADKNPIPADRASWGTFGELGDANLERERTILDASTVPGMTGDQKRLGDFYSACMNTSAVDAAGLKPLLPLLARIAAVKTREDLVALLVSLEPDGVLAPTRVTSTSDVDDAGQIISAVAPGGLSLPERDYYFREDAASKAIRDAFGEYVASAMQLAGESPETSAATAKTVFAFESTLAQATLTLVARRDPYQTHHKMTLAQLKELAPAYDWDAAFRLLKVPTTPPDRSSRSRIS